MLHVYFGYDFLQENKLNFKLKYYLHCFYLISYLTFEYLTKKGKNLCQKIRLAIA